MIGFSQQGKDGKGIIMLKMLTFISFCILLAVTGWNDYRYRKIPDKLVWALFAVAMISCITMPEIGPLSRFAGIFAASLPLFLVTMAFRGAFGGGDIKLMAAAGMFLGAKLILSALVFGLLGGSAYAGVCLLLKKKGRKEKFAFGPFLCLGIVGAYFWGETLWR